MSDNEQVVRIEIGCLDAVPPPATLDNRVEDFPNYLNRAFLLMHRFFDHHTFTCGTCNQPLPTPDINRCEPLDPSTIRGRWDPSAVGTAKVVCPQCDTLALSFRFPIYLSEVQRHLN